jgi:acyl carrier protein
MIKLIELKHIIVDTETESIIDENDIEIDDKLSDLGLDSLDIIQVVMEVEVRYNLVISDSVYENAKTVRELLKALNKNIENGKD